MKPQIVISTNTASRGGESKKCRGYNSCQILWKRNRKYICNEKLYMQWAFPFHPPIDSVPLKNYKRRAAASGLLCADGYSDTQSYSWGDIVNKNRLLNTSHISLVLFKVQDFKMLLYTECFQMSIHNVLIVILHTFTNPYSKESIKSCFCVNMLKHRRARINQINWTYFSASWQTPQHPLAFIVKQHLKNPFLKANTIMTQASVTSDLLQLGHWEHYNGDAHTAVPDSSVSAQHCLTKPSANGLGIWEMIKAY